MDFSSIYLTYFEVRKGGKSQQNMMMDVLHGPHPEQLALLLQTLRSRFEKLPDCLGH